ncbi:hypothetical protein ACFXJ8_42095 [Nonomuraea sp. NPDC059194]
MSDVSKERCEAKRTWTMTMIQALLTLLRLAIEVWDHFNGDGPGPLLP